MTNKHENLIIKRRINITNYLITYFPSDIAKIISNYDYYLEGKSYIFEDYDNSIICITMLNDGRIISESNYNILKIWNLQSGSCEVTFRIDCNIQCVNVLPDGRIVVATRSRKLLILNAHTGLCEFTFIKNVDIIIRMNVLPDGRIICRTLYGEFKIWNAQTGMCDTTIVMPSIIVDPLILSDAHILFVTKNNSIIMYNIENKTYYTLFETSDRIMKIAIYSDYQIICLVIENMKFKTKLLNLQTRKYDTLFTICTFLVNMPKFIPDIAALPDGRIITSFGKDNTDLKMWDLHLPQTEKNNKTLTGYHISDNNFIGHSEYIKKIFVLHDGRIVSWSDDRAIRVWS
jgi:WD40 repeat protein